MPRQPFLISADRVLRTRASEGKNPEEMLSEAEETEAPYSDPDPLDRDKILRALSRLSLSDQDLVKACILGTVSQKDYGVIAGLSQPGISYQITRVFSRLRWFCGAGGRFTALELKAACEPYLKAKTVAWLAVYWTTGNCLLTNKMLGIPQGHDLETFMRSMRELAPVPELAMYYSALSELKLHGPKLRYDACPTRNLHRGEKRGPVSAETLAKCRAARREVRHARYRVT